jgi:hypothetical protein
VLVGRKPPGSAGHHQSLPKHPQGEQRRTNRQNKETAGYSCNQTILLEGPRERTDLRACWAGGRGTEAKPRGARRQTYHRRGVPDPNRDPLSPFRKGRRGALQGCRQGTALRVPGKRTRSTGWWGSEEAAMEQARRANGAWVRARGWRPAAVESGRPTDSTATFTPTSQSIASDWLVCFCDTD